MTSARCPLCGGHDTAVLEWIGEADGETPHGGMLLLCMRCGKLVEIERGGRKVRILAGD